MPAELFEDVYFYMSKTLPVEQSKQLSKVLCTNGATAVDLDDKRLTHCITNSVLDEDSLEVLPETSEAHLVTPQWAERSLVLATIQDPIFYSPHPSMLFSGVIATSADLSQTDNEVLCAGISSLGGQWRTAFTKDVTHLFAMHKDHPKYATAMHFREQTGVHVLVPHWFDDVVRLGMRNLPTEEYEWPNPKVFSEAGAEAIKKLTREEGEEVKDIKKPKPLSTHKKALYDTVLVAGSDLPVQRPASNNVWNGMKILLSFSLDLKGGQYEAHVADIQRSGGIVVYREREEEEADKVAEADILITKYRSGPAYVKAYRLKKTIGTLPWLWYVRATGIMSQPTDQLLHYPVPRNPVQNFSHHVITITNYTGKDREYIKKLIVAMGAEFTPSMSGRNTILIAAYVSGTKTTKAISWNIPIVNHLWLEDCFVQWRDVPTANEKYIYFPPGVDFGTVLGEKGLGRVGYDPEELSVLEKEVATQEDADVSIRPPLASQPVRESPRKNKGKTRALSRTEQRDEDIVMAADISAGGYLDIDVPLDDDGRLSDMEIMHEQEQNPRHHDDDTRMEVDDSPSLRKSTRARAAVKSPVTPKSILKTKGKTKATAPADSEPEEQPAKTSSPAPPRRKLVRRFGRQSSTPAEEETIEAPKTPSRRGGKAQADAKSRDNQPDESNDREEPSSSHKLLVKRTYGAKSRSRSRSRMRNEAQDSEGEGPVRAKGATARSRSYSRSRRGSVESEEDAGPKNPSKSARKRSTSGGRGRKKADASEVEGIPSPRSKATRGRSATRRRSITRQKEPAVDEVKPAESSKKASRVIITRSRSRSRARQERGSEDEPSPKKSEPPQASGSKGRGKAVKEDSDMEDIVEISRPTEPKTPVKVKPSSTKAVSKRKKPTVPTDTESEVEPPPKRNVKRKESAVSVAETEDDIQKKVAGDRSSRTPRREVSVVVPTLKQVRSQSLIRGEGKDSPRGAKESINKTVPRAESIQMNEQSSPEKPKRGRPPARSTKATTKRRSPSADGSPSPPPPPAPKTRRPVANPPEAGPSNAVETPTSALRLSSKRSAATKATQKLHDEIMPDVVNFQKELKSGHVKSAYDKDQAAAKLKGKEKEVEVPKNGKGKKRVSTGDAGASGPEAEPERKKQKISAATPVNCKGRKSEAAKEEEGTAAEALQSIASPSKTRNIVVLTTQVSFSDDITKVFTRLGAKFTSKPSECTHLVAKNFVRTEKFLCGLAVASYVVNDKWVEASVIKKRILPESDYPLKDPAAESKFGVKLPEVLRRAKANKGQLFQGMTFYVTPKVPVDFKLLKNVVAAGGGQVLSQSPSLRILKGHENRYVISNQNDVSIWRPLSQHGYPIYTQELVLTGALKQQIDWESDSNKVPGSF